MEAGIKKNGRKERGKGGRGKEEEWGKREKRKKGSSESYSYFLPLFLPTICLVTL